MPVQEKENQIIFFESPRKFTGLDILLTLYGLSVAGLCVYWIYRPFDNIPNWTFIILGLLHFFFALNQISSYFAAIYTGIFDYQLRKVIFEKKGYFGNSAEEHNFDRIHRFYITQDFDPDRPEGWNVEMELKTGERRVIPHSFAREQKAFEHIIQAANCYLTDESRTKIS